MSKLIQGRSAIATVLASVLLLASGCTTARLNQFHNLAQAGIAYQTATQTVIQDAGAASVDADSALLIKLRRDLSEAERRNNIIRQDTLLKQRLTVLGLISAHNRVLQTYFEALAALSDPTRSNSVGSAAQGAYELLSKMSPDLKNATIGATSVSSFIPTLTAPIVASFKVSALNKELRIRAEAIANELALQEAAFRAVAAELKTDLQEQQNIDESNLVSQFAGPGDLSTDWAVQRQRILSTPLAVASADAAGRAATQLRNAFTAAVENRFDSAALASLMGDISSLLTITKTIEGAGK